MTLEERVAALNNLSKIKAARYFAETALHIWEKYASENDISYCDTVVGMHHELEISLLKDSLNFITNYISNQKKQDKNKLKQLLHDYLEPITAIQDMDWEIPRSVELVIYSIHNILNYINGERKTVFNEDMLYVSINQSIDALLKNESLTPLEINEKLIYFSDCTEKEEKNKTPL